MCMLFVFLIAIFPYSACGNGIIQEILPYGQATEDVTPSIRSLQPSNHTLAVNHINGFDAVAKQKEGYVQKVRGFFKAPETGEYKFYSSCSGPCQIFIGQDSSLKPRRIITQKEESLHNEFDRYPDQVSHTIYLEKDKLYYIEGMEQQKGGLGHLSVGVVLPSDKRIFPISNDYLSTEGNGDLKRKEEIFRGRKKDLTKQRDIMFKKLKEINEYIKQLTDEVKSKPKSSRKRVRQEDRKKQESLELTKNNNDDKNDLKMKGAVGINEKMIAENTAGKSGSKDEALNRKKVENTMNEEQVAKNGEKEKVENEAFLTYKAEDREENKGVKIDQREEKGHKDEESGFSAEMQGYPLEKGELKALKQKDDDRNKEDTLLAIVENDKPEKKEREEPDSNVDERMKSRPLTDDVKGNILDSVKMSNNEPELSSYTVKKIRGNDETRNPTDPTKEGFIMGGGMNVMPTSQTNYHKLNKQETNTVSMEDNGNGLSSKFHAKDSLIVEQNHVNMLKTGNQLGNIHPSTKFIMQPSNAPNHDYDDNYDDNYDDGDDDVVQLTNFAKKEISRNGSLSEKAIKKLIQIIKQNLIQNGFVKRENMTSKHSGKIERNNETEKVDGKSSLFDFSENDSALWMDENGMQSRVLLYDDVVSKLMKVIKENLIPTRNMELNGKNAGDVSNEKQPNMEKAQIRMKFATKVNGENEERKRMLSSLFLLSSEIEKFKRILQESQHKTTKQADNFRVTPQSELANAKKLTPSSEAMIGGVKKDFSSMDNFADNVTATERAYNIGNNVFQSTSGNGHPSNDHDNIEASFSKKLDEPKQDNKSRQMIDGQLGTKRENSFPKGLTDYDVIKLKEGGMEGMGSRQSMEGMGSRQSMEGMGSRQSMEGMGSRQSMEGMGSRQSMEGMESRQSMEGMGSRQSMEGMGSRQSMEETRSKSILGTERKLIEKIRKGNRSISQKSPMLGYNGLVANENKSKEEENEKGGRKRVGLDSEEAMLKTIAHNNSYTDALTKTVEQLLTDATVPGLLGDSARPSLENRLPTTKSLIGDEEPVFGNPQSFISSVPYGRRNEVLKKLRYGITGKVETESETKNDSNNKGERSETASKKTRISKRIKEKRKNEMKKRFIGNLKRI